MGTGAGSAASERSLLDLPVRHDAIVTTVGVLLGGHAAVVSAWATYCPPCRAEAPTIEQGRRRWPQLRFLAIMVDEEEPRELERVRREWETEVELVGVPAPDREIAHELLPRGLPATFIVHDGRVDRVDAFLSERALTRLVEPLIPPRPPSGTHLHADDSTH